MRTPDPAATEPPEPNPETAPEAAEGMIPAGTRGRTRLERGSMRVPATGGIIGIATALGAVGLVVSMLFWSSWGSYNRQRRETVVTERDVL